MKQKKYTFTESYNKIPYKEMKGFRTKAKKVLGVTSDNQFCNYKLESKISSFFLDKRI